jgi:U3 small nucleolar RNA-associated protein 19
MDLFQEVDENDNNAMDTQPKKIGADPFNNDEADPAKSGAMRMYFNHTEVLNIFYLTFFPLFSFPCHPNSA